jgi:hypothetical protein
VLAPTLEHAIEPLAVLDVRQHLDLAAALLGGSEADEVQLAGVVDPRCAVQGAVGVLTPPQAHVALA